MSVLNVAALVAVVVWIGASLGWLYAEAFNKSIHVETSWAEFYRGDKRVFSVPTGIRIWFDNDN